MKHIEETVEEVITLGKRATYINAALEQFTIAWGNATLGSGKDQYDRFSTPLWEALNNERDRIRERLLELNEEIND